jgi:transposase InsO family protein
MTTKYRQTLDWYLDHLGLDGDGRGVQNSLFKAELVRNKGPWRSIDDLEIAVAEYIDWFNHRRLHGEIGLVPPVEFEAQHHHTTPAQHSAPREIPVSIKPGT